MGRGRAQSLQPISDPRITTQVDRDLETMRGFIVAVVAAVGVLLNGSPRGAIAQIVPYTSDKASAAYSPAAVVQTGSRNDRVCFWCIDRRVKPEEITTVIHKNERDGNRPR